MFPKKKLTLCMLAVSPLMSYADDTTVVLDQLVVTATMTSQKAEDAPASVTVVTQEDIAKSPVSSVSDLLRETAGVNNFSDANGRDEIQIRGLDGDYTVFLVDGKRVSSKSAFAKGSDADLNSVPLSAIERIEVIRGPMSTLYGADAIGGVINIITKKPKKGEAWTGTVSTEVRSIESGEGGDQFRLGASARGSITEDVSAAISVEGVKQDAWFAQSGDVDPLREEKKAQNLTSTVSWQLDEQQALDFDFGYNHDDRPYQAYNDDPDYRDQEITRYDFAVTHKGNWDWGDTTVFIKREMSDVYDYNTAYATPEHSNLEENNTYAKLYANKTLGMHSLMAGVDYRGEEVKDNYFFQDTGKFTTNTYGVFAQDGMSLTDDLTFTLSGRVDNHSVYGNNFSPRAYAVYQLNDSVTIKGGVSKAFKAPAATYLTEEYRVASCGGACYLAGNPDLEAETSTSYEFGIEVRQQDFSASATVFRNNIDNLIEREVTYDSTGSPVAAEWINVAKAMTQGLELSSTLDLTNDLRLKANYTYLDTEATDSSGDTTVLTGRPEHQASATLDYQATDIVGTFITANYIKGMQYSQWVSGTGTVFSELPGYTRTDIGIVADLTDALVVRAGIKNITDVRLDEEDTGYTTYELGRNYYVSAAYEF